MTFAPLKHLIGQEMQAMTKSDAQTFIDWFRAQAADQPEDFTVTVLEWLMGRYPKATCELIDKEEGHDLATLRFNFPDGSHAVVRPGPEPYPEVTQ